MKEKNTGLGGIFDFLKTDLVDHTGLPASLDLCCLLADCVSKWKLNGESSLVHPWQLPDLSENSESDLKWKRNTLRRLVIFCLNRKDQTAPKMAPHSPAHPSISKIENSRDHARKRQREVQSFS